MDVSAINNLVPEYRFSTTSEAEIRQFALWREQVSPFLVVDRGGTRDAARQDTDPFRAEFKGYDLGKMYVAVSKKEAERYIHNAAHIRKNSADHWLLSLRKEGTSVSRCGDRLLVSQKGTLDLRSLAFPYSGESSETEGLYVFLDRDGFPKISDRLDARNHTAFEGALATIAKELLLSLEKRLPHLRQTEVHTVTDALSAMIGALVNQAANENEAAQMPVAASQFELARKYVQANLVSPDLTPESIGAALKISRRQLYYLFAKHGGVSQFIRRRRLAICHEAIANTADHRPIHTIAFEYGFTNPAQFSRQFRAEFGYSPSEAREAHILGYKAKEREPKSFADWLSQSK